MNSHLRRIEFIGLSKTTVNNIINVSGEEKYNKLIAKIISWRCPDTCEEKDPYTDCSIVFFPSPTDICCEIVSVYRNIMEDNKTSLIIRWNKNSKEFEEI